MDFNQLNLFLRVADEGSLSAAARSMGLQRSSVSRRIAALEAKLGVRLFHRTTRKLRLTASGEWLRGRIEPMMSGVAEAVAAIPERSAIPSGVLRVSLAADIGLHIAPFLGSFRQNYPEIDVELVVSSHIADLEAEGLDMAIRAASSGLDDSPLIARRLMDMTAGIFANPAYLEQHPPLKTTEDLAAHGMLMTPGMQRRYDLPMGRRALVANDPLVLKACIEAGVGVGWLPVFLTHEAVQNGQLQRVLPELELDGLKLFAVYPPALRDVPKLRVFIEALVEFFGAKSLGA